MAEKEESHKVLAAQECATIQVHKLNVDAYDASVVAKEEGEDSFENKSSQACEARSCDEITTTV